MVEGQWQSPVKVRDFGKPYISENANFALNNLDEHNK